MDATAHMQMAYPFLFDEADSRFAPQEVLEWALATAVAFRPLCLPDDLQNLAQAHYAAYLLASRFVAQAVVGSSPVAQTVAGPIVERTEGSVSTKYATGTTGSRTASGVRGGDPGPAAPYAAWASLASRCGPVPGLDPAAAPRIGAIIVRSNPERVW